MDNPSAFLPLLDLRTAIDNMAEAVLVFDAEYTILYQNAAALALSHVPTGRGRQDVERAIERRTPEGRPLTIDEAPVMRALRGETVRGEEVYFRNRESGAESILIYSADPIRNESGNVVRAVVNIRDVTAEKRAERKSSDHEAQLRVLFENMAEPLFVADSATLRVTANAAFRDLFLTPELRPETADDCSGIFELRHLNGRPVSEEMRPLNRALRGESFTNLELEVRRADGSLWIVAFTGNAVRNDKGAVIQAVLTCRDVTEKKRAEQELERIRYNLETATQIANVGSWANDGSGALWWSEETCRIFGVPDRGTLHTADFFRFVHPEDRERVRTAGAAAVSSGSDYEIEHRIVRADGGIRFVHQRAKALTGRNGEPSRLIGSIQDVTERKRVERELHTQREQLEATFHAIQEGVVVLDMQGNLILLNEAQARINGFADPHEMRRHLAYFFEVYEFRSPDGALLPTEEWPASRVLRGESLHGLELLGKRLDTGQEWCFSFSGQPVLDRSGEQILAVVITRDATEERRAARALAESEERLRLTMEAANAGTFEYRPLTGEVLLDERSKLFWGCAANETSFYDVLMSRIHPADRDLTEQSVQRAFADGSLDAQYRVVAPDETVRWIVSKGRVHFDGSQSERRAVRLLGINLEVTERKRAEEALRELTARFETLANNMSQLAWMADREGSIYWFNQRWYDYTGTTPDQVRGWAWSRVHHTDHLKRVVENFRRSVESGQSWEDTFPLRGKDGEYRWFLSRALPIRNEAGEIATWFGTNTDITDLRKTAAELERIDRIVKLAHAASQSGAWEWNLETGELTWTDEYFRLFGLEPNFTPTVTRFISLIHPEDREQVSKSIQDCIRQCAAEFRTEYRAVVSGLTHWIERRGQVICDASGKPVRMVGISTDITARKQLEQSLIRSNEDLARFAYVSSHDLQEPLRTICSFSALLKRRNRGRLDEDSEQFLTYIVEGAARMTEMVNDLLDYSQVSTASTVPFTVDLNVVLEATLANLRQVIEETGACISSDVLPLVRGNDSLFERVFRNLIGNALKYRSPERAPAIRVTVRNYGANWEFAISDNGIGFKDEYAEQVFVMFKRLHGPGAYTGSGIGLAIVKRIVERHGGTVRAESVPGTGSTFYFTLPSYDEATDGQTAGSS